MDKKTKEDAIQKIVLWFYARDNAWATIDEIIDNVDGLMWDNQTRNICQTHESGGIFENRYRGQKGAGSTTGPSTKGATILSITRGMKRQYRLKEDYYEKLCARVGPICVRKHNTSK